MPLRSRLLQVPELRARYLECVRRIARESLDWEWLGPQVAARRTLIEDAVRDDTRKLDSHEAFRRATISQPGVDGEVPAGSIQAFARDRQAFLLKPDAVEKE